MSSKTRKLMWSAPLVAVFAVVGALAAFGALGLGGVSADELPDHPQNLKVKAADGNTGRTTLVLNWDAPESGAPDMYRIDFSVDNEKFWFLTEVPGTTTTYSHVARPRGQDREIKDGWERFYRVYAVNSHGSGAVSTAESATTKDLAVPGEVMQVRGSSSDPEAINLSWAAPDDGGSDILGYCIAAWPTGTTADSTSTPPLAAVSDATCLNLFKFDGPSEDDVDGDYRADGNTGTNDRSGGVIRIFPATAYAHEKLRARQGWTYKVYAFNRYGNSKTASAELEIRTASAEEPTPPGNLFALQGTNGQINLYWTAPDDGGQDIASYRIEVSNKKNYWPSSSVTAGTTLTGAGTKESTTDLAPDTGDPDDDDAMAAVIPMNADTQDASDAHQFQHNATNFAAGNLYYQVKTITGSGATEMMSAFTSTSVKIVDTDSGTAGIQFAPPIPAPGLAADGTVVQDATNNDDENDPVEEDDTKPGVIKLTVTQPMVTVDGNTVPLEGANSYRVDVSTNTGKTWTTVHTATRPINGTEYEHEGLDPEKRVHFRLFAKKGSEYGLASTPVLDYAGNTDRPGNTRELMATADGAGMINLSWKAPASNGGSPVEQYCILMNELDEDDDPVGTHVTRASIIAVDDTTTAGDQTNCTRLGEPPDMPIDEPGNKVFQVDADTTMVTFTELEAESRWQFEVFALNDATDMDVDNNGTDGAATGTGAEDAGRYAVSGSSNKVSATTDEAVVPGAPQRLTAQLARDTNEVEGVGNQGVLLLWNPPDDPPGAPVKTYKIERKIDDGDYSVRASSHNAAVTHWVDPSEPGMDEMRTYRITAINDVDPGTEMATVTIPLAEHTHNNAPMAVGTIADMTLTAGGDASIMEVKGYFSDADGDTLTYSAMSSDMAVATAMIAEGTAILTVTPMAAGSATITVTADDGTDSVDQTFMVTVEEAPTELTKPVITRTNPVGSGIILVSWNPVDGAAGYTLIAANLTDPSAPTRTAAATPGQTSGQIQQLEAGDEYLIFVGVFNDELEYKLSDYVPVRTDPEP